MAAFPQRPVIMTEPTEAQRRRALIEAEANLRLDGIELDEEDRAMLEPYLQNRMTVEECIASMRARHDLPNRE